MSSTITFFCCAIALTLLAWASWSDLVSRSIPNRISAALIVLFTALLVSSAPLGVERALATLATNAMVAVVVLCIGFALWSRGALGGGDVKLISATSFWAGPTMVLPMLMIVAICGGAIAAVQIAAARITAWLPAVRLAAAADPSRHDPSRLDPSRHGDADHQAPAAPGFRALSVPYGVAIAIGGAWVVARHL